MVAKLIVAIGAEVLHKLASFLCGEASADTDVMKTSAFIEKTEQERTDRLALSVLVPPEAGNDTVAVSFVFHLQHDSLARFIDSRSELGHHTIQSRPF